MNVLEMTRRMIGFSGILVLSSLPDRAFTIYLGAIERTVGAALRGRPRFTHGFKKVTASVLANTI